MAEGRPAFEHSTPALYDRYMGPLLFAPWAELVAEASVTSAARADSGDSGRDWHRHACSEQGYTEAEIVATDLNPAVIAFSQQSEWPEQVSFRAADAQALPFFDDFFDLVVCQFGVMFIPGQGEGQSGARRVLTPTGRYLVVTFDRLERNPVPEAAGKAVAALFPDDPPRYMETGPFSYADPALIETDLQAAGFAEIQIETVTSRAE